MTRTLIITNPRAARVGGRALEAARRRLAAGGLSVEVARTTGPGDAERLARAAVADGAELLVAHGGDGTVMEVVAALVGTGRPLGLLPGGTGNLLAGNLGIRRAPGAAAEVILAGRRRAIDVGRLQTSIGVRHFVVAAGMGFDAELMHRTAAHHKRFFGVSAYVGTAVAMASAITRAALRIETDEGTVDAQAATVLVANCGEIIPGLLPLAPDIVPDDGVLNVVVLDAQSLPAAARIAWRLLLRRSRLDPGIRFLRARSVRISADRDLPVQADGEACGRAPLAVSVVPGGLTVLAPPRG